MRDQDMEYCLTALLDSGAPTFIGAVDADGFPHIKAMLAPRRREGCRTIYYSTNTSSRHVAQYRANPKACVYLCDPGQFIGATLVGAMEVLEDAGLKKALWRDGDEQYYPQGVADPDYCVLRFRAGHGRLYDGERPEDIQPLPE